MVFQEKHRSEPNILGVAAPGSKQPNNLTSGSAHIQLSAFLATFLRRNFLGVSREFFSFSFAFFTPLLSLFSSPLASLTCSICFWGISSSQHFLNSGFTLSFSQISTFTCSFIFENFGCFLILLCFAYPPICFPPFGVFGQVFSA